MIAASASTVKPRDSAIVAAASPAVAVTVLLTVAVFCVKP
jgi:hypothetical protein